MSDPDQIDAWRRTWTIGDYPAIGDLWASAGHDLIATLDERTGLGGRDLVDVACGHGTTAIAAARAGATVTAVDLTPRLLHEARRRADDQGLEITFLEGDFHDLPVADRAADVVTSTFGVFMAADAHRVAAELARIVRPGGHVAVTAWAREGALGDLAPAIAEHLDVDVDVLTAERPDSAAWGERDGLDDRFAGTGVEVEEVSSHAVVVPVADPDEMIEIVMASSGPWLEVRAQLERDGADWSAVLTGLRRRWHARMTPAGLPLAYGRAILRRRE